MTVRLRLRVPPLPNARVRLDDLSVDRAMLASQVTWRRSIVPGFVRWTVYLLQSMVVGLFTLGIWRFGNDIGATQPFFIEDGFFSHWQVYFALAGFVAFAAISLRNAIPESRLEELLAEAEILAYDGEEGELPASIPRPIETPCSVEVRRAIS
jgi:hypothetical protein